MQLDTGDQISSSNANWEFKGKMVNHFDTHIANSVPLYNEGHDLVHKISDFFISDQSLCYEIGSSTAKLLSGLAQRHSNKNATFVGIEIEKDMHQKAVEKTKTIPSIQLINENILDFPLEKSDFIVCY